MTDRPIDPGAAAKAAKTAKVATSDELFAEVRPGVTLCHQTFGDPAAEPLLLVMGLGGPMTWWDDAFCVRLAQAGFFVVRFDNRDAGRSSRGTGRVPRAMLVRGFLGRRVRTPYTLRDLADDAFALLDHLDIAAAHLVGVSMGGMIVQTMALAQPERARSLASFSSTTGQRTVGWQHPVMLRNLLFGGGAGREAYVRQSLVTWRMIGSPAYPMTPDDMRRRAEETYDRGVSLGGLLRQMAAIVTQPDRTPALRGLDVPTLVVHGLADKMVHVSGGRATAHAVPHAELRLFDGMGHDLPEPLWGSFVDAVRRTADRAEPAPG